tara:strand:+ start:4992 stop:5615 length:624 start_codon:yes stop_codon:yes gene_type:complete
MKNSTTTTSKLNNGLIQNLAKAKSNAEKGSILSRENTRLLSLEKRQFEAQTMFGGFWFSLGKLISDELNASGKLRLSTAQLKKLNITKIERQRRSDAKLFFENYDALQSLTKRFNNVSALLKEFNKQNSKSSETSTKVDEKSSSKEDVKSDVGQSDNNEVVKVGTFQVPNVKQMAEAIVMQAIENGLEVKELKALNAEIANQIKALA